MTSALTPSEKLENLLIALELETQAARFESRAAEQYPESVFPVPQAGAQSSPDTYAAAGYRNAYRSVAHDLRTRATQLRRTIWPDDPHGTRTGEQHS